jgi:hypothetical protein
MHVKILILILIVTFSLYKGVILANQDLVVPKTRLEYVTPERENFDEKIQYGLEEII